MESQTKREVVSRSQGKNHMPESLKGILFLYLCIKGNDYGWHISEIFKKATKKRQWVHKRGWMGLKHPGKVDGALKAMAISGLLSREDADPAGRIYYHINLKVLSNDNAKVEQMLGVFRRCFKDDDAVIEFINKTSKDSSKMIDRMGFIARIFINFYNGDMEEPLKNYVSSGDIEDLLMSITTIKN